MNNGDVFFQKMMIGVAITMGSMIVSVIVAGIVYYFNSKNRLSNLEKTDERHDKELNEIKESIETRASNEHVLDVKEEMRRGFDKINNNVQSLNDTIVKALLKK